MTHVPVQSMLRCLDQTIPSPTVFDTLNFESPHTPDHKFLHTWQYPQGEHAGANEEHCMKEKERRDPALFLFHSAS